MRKPLLGQRTFVHQAPPCHVVLPLRAPASVLVGRRQTKHFKILLLLEDHPRRALFSRCSLLRRFLRRGILHSCLVLRALPLRRLVRWNLVFRASLLRWFFLRRLLLVS